MKLGEELRKQRRLRRVTLSDVSERTGLSVSFLSDIERNRTNPSLETLEKLADYFQLPVNQLLAAAETEQEETEQFYPPGYQEMLEELADRIDPQVKDLLLQAEHRARRRPQTKEDWVQLYYSLKSALGR